MRFLCWCLGVLVLLEWRSSLSMHGAPVQWSYVSAMIFWIFVGAGVLLVSVVRLVAGKMHAGAPTPPHKPSVGAPATQRGE